MIRTTNVKQTLPKPGQVPKLTKDGIMRSALNDSLFQQIQQFYRGNASVPEDVSDYIYTKNPSAGPASTITQLPVSLQKALHAELQPMAEAWSGRKLLPTYVYGVRTYNRGAVLRTHVDRDHTHIVSAILNVDQKVEQPWPIYIQSELDSPHPWRQLYLAPGELLFYEGNRLQHGRPNELVGTKYANVFIHYGLL